MLPTLGNGKICYLEIPAVDIPRSVEFYEAVFGWKTRRRGDGQIAFDDGVGEVSGTWVKGRPPSTEPGLLVYVMVDSVAETIEVVVANGGEIVQPIGVDAPEITGRFRDPAGNVIGLYQEPTPVTTVIKILRDIEERLALAWVEGNRAFIEKVLADDWTVTDLTGRVLTRDDVLDEAFGSKERQVVSMQIDDINVRPFRGWAIVTGRTRAAGEYQGEAAEVTLRFTDVFANRDGHWQVVASQATLLS